MKYKKTNLILTTLLLLLTACSSQDERNGADIPGVATGPVIATMEGREIHAGQFEEYFKSRHGLKKSISAQAARENLVDMLTSEALYQEALRLKIDQVPEIQRRIKQILVRRLLEDKIEKPVRQWRITDKELQKYFNDHLKEFSRPEQVRVADIFIAVHQGASAEQREKKRKLAREVMNMAINNRNTTFGFSYLIRKYSDTPRDYPLGDTGFFDRSGAPFGIPVPLVKAAFSLKKTGEIADRIIETDDGYHVIMLVGKRSAFKKTLKELAPMLKRRMKREEEARRRKAFIEEVRNKANWQIDEDLFEKVISEMNTTSSPRTMTLRNREYRGIPPAFPQTGKHQTDRGENHEN